MSGLDECNRFPAAAAYCNRAAADLELLTYCFLLISTKKSYIIFCGLLIKIKAQSSLPKSLLSCSIMT